MIRQEIVEFLDKLHTVNKYSYEENIICRKECNKNMKLLIKAIKGEIEVTNYHIDLINQASKKLEHNKIGIYIGLLKTQFN